MEIRLNDRGNGACPICIYLGRCSIREKLHNSVKDIYDSEDHGMELVIYTCPFFKESE